MRKWWPLVAICLGTFMFLLDTTVLSVALPDIGEGLSASLSALQWVANIYTLVLAVLMLTMGALVDRLGARTVYVAGLAVFGVASLLCGLSPNAGVLIAARGVQGIGGAAMAVTTFALIDSVYRGPDMGQAMGVFGAVTGLAAAVGPMLGGIVTQYFSWRTVFFLNLPLVAVAVALSLRVLAAGRQGAGMRIDLPGTVAFAGCAGSLTYALNWLCSREPTAPVHEFGRRRRRVVFDVHEKRQHPSSPVIGAPSRAWGAARATGCSSGADG